MSDTRTPDPFDGHFGLSAERPSFAETFLAIAETLAERSSCPSGARHGCVIAVNDRIVATGYGSPASGVPPCEKCWLRKKFKETGIKDWSCCPSIHAELNAIISAARMGASILGGVVYLTKAPCDACRRALVNAGVAKVIARGEETLLNSFPGAAK